MGANASSQKIGLAPGTLKYTGSRHIDRIKLTATIYNEQSLEVKEYYD